MRLAASDAKMQISAWSVLINTTPSTSHVFRRLLLLSTSIDSIDTSSHASQIVCSAISWCVIDAPMDFSSIKESA